MSNKEHTVAMKSDIAEALHKRRTMTESTTRTYVSLLSTLYTKLNGSGGLDWFTKESDAILKYINAQDKKSTRKTQLSALWVLTQVPAYSETMRENMRDVAAEYKEQKVNPDRVARMKTFAEVCAIHDRCMAAYKRNPTHDNTVDMLITGLMSGYYEGAPPRRLMDYSEMQIRDFQKNSSTDNYIQGNTMYFHKYKTVKHDKANGVESTIQIPPTLRPIITKWKKVYDGSYLLCNTQGAPFTQQSLNKRVTKLFGFSVDMLRSIYLSHKYANIPALAEMEKTAAEMGHSVDAALTYYTKKA